MFTERFSAEGYIVIVRTARRYKGSFPCSPAGAREARCAVRDFARAWLFDRDLSDFEGAVGEVLANAVEHGAGPKISVECYCESDRVIAEIQDYGPGFLPPPAASIAPPAGASRGYGLFIVHRLVDNVEFLEKGRMLRLVKAASKKGCN